MAEVLTESLSLSEDEVRQTLKAIIAQIEESRSKIQADIERTNQIRQENESLKAETRATLTRIEKALSRL